METTIKTAEFGLFAANYDEMFDGLIKLVEDFWKVLPSDIAQFKSTIKSEIMWAKSHLKKQDRIVWYLRWVRLMLLKEACGDNPERQQQYYKPEIDRMSKAVGSDVMGYRVLRVPFQSEIGRLHENLDHYLSLPIPEIQNHVFGKEAPDSLFQKFKNAETAWQQKSKNLLTPHEDDEIIIQFPDGWAWWKLGRSYCSEEARAMGHCGNVNGKTNTTERILSLRRPVKYGKQTMWEPFLTFILDQDGLLGEMKGRNNEKPAERYHKYIIALLERTDIVKGVKGGGYLPSHNFSLNDLDPDVQEKLEEINPNLISCVRRLRQLNGVPDQALVKRIDASGNINGYYEPRLKGWVTEDWANPGALVSDAYDNQLTLAYELFSGEDPSYSNSWEKDQRIREVIESLPEREIELILNWIQTQGAQVEKTKSNRETLTKYIFGGYGGNSADINEAARVKLWDVWKAGVTDGMRQDIGEQIKETLESELYFRNGSHFVSADRNDFWNSMCYAVIPAYRAAELADGGDEDEEEEFYDDGGDEDEEEEFYDDGGGDMISVDYRYLNPYQQAYRAAMPELEKIVKGLDNRSKKQVHELEKRFEKGDRQPFVEWVDSVLPGAFTDAAQKSWDVNAAAKAAYAEFAQYEFAFPPEEPEGKKMKKQHASLLLQKDASFELIAANYEEMFTNVQKLAASIGMQDQYATPIKNEIAWAKQHLKKQDRIVWWLRWYRLGILNDLYSKAANAESEAEYRFLQLNKQKEHWQGQHDHYVNKGLTPPKEWQTLPKELETEWNQLQQNHGTYKQREETVKKALDAELKSLTNRTGQDIHGGSSLSWFARNHQEMDHYLSLPTPGIQNVVWDKQTPLDLQQTFQAAEKEWQDRTKGLLKPHTEPETDSYGRPVPVREGEQPELDSVFIQFQDGWAWWKLSRAYCSEEAKAMGHCGNVTGQEKTNQRILSLRQPKKVGNETYWEPHLTFILEPNGFLGEMKGKANQKPAPQYHKYIMTLLEDPRIKGLKGGGYAPERNFKLTDLTKEQQEEVLAKNPNLNGCQVMLQRNGVTPELVQKIEALLGFDKEGDNPTPFKDPIDPKYPELKGWVTEEWKSVDDLLEDKGNETAKWISQQFNGNGDYFDYAEHVSWSEAFTNMEKTQEAMLRKFIEVEHPDVVENWKEDHDDEDFEDADLEDVISEYDPDVQSELWRAVETGMRYGAEEEMYEALSKAVENFSFDETGEDLLLPKYKSKDGKEGITWDSPVKAYLSIQAAATLADRGEPFQYYIDEDLRGNDKIEVSDPYYGWSGWSQSGFNDSFEEAFGRPYTQAEQEKKQKEMEEEAKVRPDLIPVKENGKITGWRHNPEYKGPELTTGGYIVPDISKWKVITDKNNEYTGQRDVRIVDDKGKTISWHTGTRDSDETLLRRAQMEKAQEDKIRPNQKKTKKAPKRKTTPGAKKKKKQRASMIAAADEAWKTDEWYFNKKKNELLEKLKALPYANEIMVFGSASRGKEKPGDIDLYIDLRGKGKHPAYKDLLALANEYYGYLDPFIIADAGLYNGKPMYHLLARNDRATGWIHSRNKAKMMKSMESEGTPLTSIQPFKTASDVKKAQGKQPVVEAHRTGSIMWIDWMWVPNNMRGKGMGRSIYEAWEARLPKDITLIRLFAADAGDGPAAGFWEKMGFEYVYDRETGDYELDGEMWKGVNGNRTPKSINPYEHEEEGYGDDSDQ